MAFPQQSAGHNHAKINSNRHYSYRSTRFSRRLCRHELALAGCS